MTPTETAIRALVAALATAAGLTGARIPPPLRNEDQVTRMVEASDNAKLSRFLNVLDGDRGDTAELLGADLGNTEAYELTQNVSVELGVAGGTSDERETAFDDARKAIWDALKPVMVGDVPTYLGGAVDGITLANLIVHEKTTVAGLPNIKACVFVFALTYTSADPF